MSEKILKALMQLFAIIGNNESDGVYGRNTVDFFLKQQLNKEQVAEYLRLYDEHCKVYHKTGEEGEKQRKRAAVGSVKVIVICRQINEELTRKQKILVLLRLIEFVKSGGQIGEQESEFISLVSSSFSISEDEYAVFLSYVLNQDPVQEQKSDDILIINNLPGELHVLRIKSIGIYLIRYYGSSGIYLNGQIVNSERILLLTQGSAIRSSRLQPVYYSDIVSGFLREGSTRKISFVVKDLEFVFPNGKTGLHKLSFSEDSGKMIGIMGGSGAGKSTLLNLLNGNDSPSSGWVLINGIDLYKEKAALEGVVGYVPQDDLLIEELTVYQNLFYNTKLCFATYSDEKIARLVKKLLLDLGLEEICDLKVGNPLKKTISGGQRKRLNIALELIREPSVLFVDEPTSGLSSRDSENSMDLLKELSLKGKLVFVVIHQPSSDIFKMFDKLLILDLGGYPIYYGNPVEALIYFKTAVNQINANDVQCEVCGTVNPEQLFNIIEAKVLDENGTPTYTRRISPHDWNELYLKKNVGEGPAENAAIQVENRSLENEIRIPQVAKATSGAENITSGAENTTLRIEYATSSVLTNPKIQTNFKKPGFFSQMKVYLSRDILAKLSNTQYLAINFLEAPILAFILAFLTKFYRSGSDYVFSENKNLVAYIFMCVVVSLFVGLTVSAEEIIHDRKILKRESFLNLSRGAYLLSKILLLFLISAVQAGSLVLVGNTILEIHGMNLAYWLVLFSTACFANMLGLNISSSFDSVVTIYILIPFLLIPQLLLSGVIVKFDELHPALSGKRVVPLTGDLMTSRWAFEAIAVHQFQNNEYEKNVYKFEKARSRAKFKKDEWVNQMNEAVKSGNLHFLVEEIKAEQEQSAIPFKYMNELQGGTLDDKIKTEILAYIDQVKKQNFRIYEEATKSNDSFFSDFLTTEEGRKKIDKLRKENQNDKLKEFVTNYPVIGDNAFIEGDRLFQKADPVFMDAVPGTFLRAHFCAPRKFLFGRLLPTYWVNLAVIWLMAAVLAVTLYFDILRKALEGTGRMLSRKQKFA